ncbi:amidase [Mesorhizobium sp. BH1-1-4]|uniref:amidase n=1 Tax=Mesorhizobium sp. BH1-1-4 TaxID=2876662 RepID=UPI001CD0D0F6|nr:amidase [Mesorhizobium sp. BH1-1-4]MBZ9994257.1 amidase [Mesorhizobium sp. BH1-1-4]
MVDVNLRSLKDLRDLIVSRDITPLEAVEASLHQIEVQNPRLHAFLTVCEAEAMQAARQAERLLDKGGPLPPLLGVPIAIKDAEATKGTRTTFGSKFYGNHVPDRDTIHVERLRAAGAIIVGKTNTPEFTLLGETTNLLGPDCSNPCDPSRTSGGSSGGSAAAIAAGIVPLATGTDTAGSITIPSAFCGTFGIKPSHRAIPVWPNWDDWPSLYDVGPITNSARDAALALDVTVGFDSRDPYACRLQRSTAFTDGLDRPLPRLRIGWLVAHPDLPVEPACRAAVHKIAALLSRLGHHVDEVSLPIEPPGEIIDTIGCAYEYAKRGFLLDEDGAELHRETRHVLERGRHITATQLLNAGYRRQRIKSAFETYFESFDILLAPATACRAFPLRTPPAVIDGCSVPEDWTGFSPFNMYANLTGGPVATLPVWSPEDGGLPVGVLFFGAFGRDDVVLQLCHSVEGGPGY